MFSFLLFIAVVVLGSMVTRARTRVDELSDEVGMLQRRVRDVEAELKGNQISASPKPAELPQSQPALPPVLPSTPPLWKGFAEPVRTEAPATPEADLPPRITAPPPIAAPAAEPVFVAASTEPEPSTWSWENFLGARLFAWAGGFALFLAVGFFLKYSFERNLIPPAMRVAFGYLAGLGLIGGGYFLRRKEYRVTSQTLCGSGVVILYAATFAASSFYHLIPQTAGFVIMTLVTAGAFFLAVTMEAQVVALLGMLGGFLTPILFSTGTDAPLALFVYIGLLDLGLMAVSYFRRWPYLVGLAAIGTALMEFGWLGRFYEPGKIWTAFAILSSFQLLFLAALAMHRKRGEQAGWFDFASLLPPAVSLFTLLVVSGTPVVAEIPLVYFGLLLVTDLCLVGSSLFRKEFQLTPQVAGGAAFLLIAIWIGRWLSPELTYWALGAPVLFGILHSVLPLLVRRLAPKESSLIAQSQFAPVLSILLLMFGFLQAKQPSLSVWPCILVMDVAAFGMAIYAGSVLGVIGAIAFTFVGTGLWVERMTGLGGAVSNLGGCLGLLVFFGLAFLAGSLALKRRMASSEDPARSPAGMEILPGGSVLMPFLILTQIAASFPNPNPTALFSAALIFAAAATWLGLFRDLRPLFPAALAGCASVELAWHLNRYREAAGAVELGWNILFYLGFSLAPFLGKRTSPESKSAWITSAVAGPIHFLLCYLTVRATWPNDWMGVVPALFAILPFLLLQWTLKQIPVEAPHRLSLCAWFGGATLLFVTLIVPIQFHREWLTLGWAFEGAALCWLFRKVPHPGLRATGIALLLIATFRLCLVPIVISYHERTANLLFNWFLYTYGLTIASLIGASLLLPPNGREINGKDLRAVLLGCAGILAFLLMNIEIANHFATGQFLTFEFSGSFARDMSYSIGWALFSLGLLVLGIRFQSGHTRLSSMALLSVTLLKLFLHDLSNLDQLYRIGAFLGVAIVLMVSAFLYQRFLATPRPRQ